MKSPRLSLTSILLTLITACGGGSGAGPPADFPLLQPDENAPTAPEVLLSLSGEEGNPLADLPILQSGELHIELEDRAGRPVPEVLVSIDGDNVEAEPASVITDTDGRATVTFTATPDSIPGTATLNVSFAEGGAGMISMTVSAADIVLGHVGGGRFANGEIGVARPLLGPEETTTLQLAVRHADGELVSAPIHIRLTSPCAAAEPALASLSAEIISSQGLATASYGANGCEGTDTITASVEPISDVQAQAVVRFTDEVTPGIEFTAWSTQQISLLGTGDGGRPDTAQATFAVTGPDQAPLENYPVAFTLTSTLGGVMILAASEQTDRNGIASVTVQAGTQAALLRVRATIAAGDTLFSATSEELLITSGLADQNSFSLSADRLNVAGAGRDGETITLTARLADHFNHPVPDGTSVSFSTEYGAVQALCQTTAGSCQVLWTSQEPRHSLSYADLTPTIDDRRCPTYGDYGPCPRVLHTFQGGRTSILATLEGEESFTDRNGNGRYDAGEVFGDLAEAFNDHNEDGRYNPAVSTCSLAAGPSCASGAEETFVDVDHDAEYSLGNGLYNGSLCSREQDGADCSRELVTVRASIVLVASSSEQRLAVVTATNRLLKDNKAVKPGRYTLYLADRYNNPPATGSQLRVSSSECAITSAASSTRGNTNAPGAWAVPLQMSERENTTTINGEIDISLGLPDGREQMYSVPCRDDTLVESSG